MRTLVTTLVVMIAAAAVRPAPARADDGMPRFDRVDDGDAREDSSWTFEFGSYARWLGDRSAASLTPGALVGGRLTAGHHLLTLPGPRRGIDLGVMLRFLAASNDGQVFQTLDTRLDQLGFLAGARFELEVWRGISATAQLDAGVARTSAVIGDQLEQMAPVDDTAWGFLGGGSVGIEVGGVWRRHYTVGLAADLGYAVTAPVTMRAFPRSRPADDLSIPTSFAALGRLDTRGTTLSVSIRLGF
jgi:hypothetical protein